MLRVCQVRMMTHGEPVELGFLGLAAVHRCRVRRADRRWRAWHGVRGDLQHAAGGGDRSAAGTRLGERPYRRDLHHRDLGDQPLHLGQYRPDVVSAVIDPRTDRRRERRLSAHQHQWRDGQAVRARLSGRHRRLPADPRHRVPAKERQAEGCRAARPDRRFPRCGGRRWLGADRHVQPARPGCRATQSGGDRQQRRILSDCGRLGHIHLESRRPGFRGRDASAC